jgi:hypothetical protein
MWYGMLVQYIALGVRRVRVGYLLFGFLSFIFDD